MAAMISHTNIVEEECQKAAKDSMLLATDLADYLVNIKVPFRDAHHIVGDVVGLAENKGVALDQLTLRDLKSVDSRFKRDALAVFSLDRALEERKTTGSPGLKEVKKQLRIWQSRLKDERQ
jgi:argininosuccinate lyase